jgi:hypothetical protein
MSEEDVVGFGKPPRHSRFKPGRSGNPAGRPPKDRNSDLAAIIREVMGAPTQYREGGQTKAASRLVLAVRLLIKRAVEGDVRSAEALLKVRGHAKKYGDVGIQKIRVKHWLPDRIGQTGEQKTLENHVRSEADAVAWWSSRDSKSKLDGNAA